MLNNSYIAIAPRNETEAYVCWDLDPDFLNQMSQQQQSTLTLYICDITDISEEEQYLSGQGSSETSSPLQSVISRSPNVQVYRVQVDIHDCYVSIPSLHREYVAELGYEDPDGKWLMLTQSTPLRMYPTHSM